jgi:CDP-diacylglycerol--serine O-phosphatidyltransferase
MRAQIPNAVTLLNLFFGCCALLQVLSGRPDLAVWFTLGSFACDTADGLVARALYVHSELGKQLDSLADVVSFGVVPGAMLYMMMAGNPAWTAHPTLSISYSLVYPAALPAFVLSMFAAYRLGKFNVDTRQTSYFLGLSTPGATVFVLGLALATYNNRYGLGDWLQDNRWVLYALTGVFSWLMVSEIPLAGLKIKGLRWKGNEALILLVALFLALLFLVQELAFCIIIPVYIAYSIVYKKAIT